MSCHIYVHFFTIYRLLASFYFSWVSSMSVGNFDSESVCITDFAYTSSTSAISSDFWVKVVVL